MIKAGRPAGSGRPLTGQSGRHSAKITNLVNLRLLPAESDKAVV